MVPTERQTIDGLISMLQDAGAVRDVSYARLITDGMQNLVLVVDEELVARIPRDEGGRRALAEERQLLKDEVRRAFVPADGYDPGRERRAEQRARMLLRSCINEEEWTMYRDLGFIRVWGGLAEGPLQVSPG